MYLKPNESKIKKLNTHMKIQPLPGRYFHLKRQNVFKKERTIATKKNKN